MNVTNICRSTALILSLLSLCGCQRTYDFDKDIYSKCPEEGSSWWTDFRPEKRLAALPGSGVISYEMKLTFWR